jgi:hypothetical protein
MFWQMSSDEEAYDKDNFSDTYNDNSSEGTSMFTFADAVVMLAKLKAAMDNAAPVINPPVSFPKMTRQQWMEVNPRDENRCIDNLRMSPDDFKQLHNILVGFGSRVHDRHPQRKL